MNDYSDVYNFLITYKRANDGNSPSIRQITDACGYKSTSAAHHALIRLQEAGKIKLLGDHGTSRLICIVGGFWNLRGNNGSKTISD